MLGCNLAIAMLCVLFTHLFCSYQRCLSATVIGNCKICKFWVFRYWYLGSRLSLGPLLKRKRNAPPGGMSGTRLWNRGPAGLDGHGSGAGSLRVWMGGTLGALGFGWVANQSWSCGLARLDGTRLWGWGLVGLDGWNAALELGPRGFGWNAADRFPPPRNIATS